MVFASLYINPIQRAWRCALVYNNKLLFNNRDKRPRAECSRSLTAKDEFWFVLLDKKKIHTQTHHKITQKNRNFEVGLSCQNFDDQIYGN